MNFNQIVYVDFLRSIVDGELIDNPIHFSVSDSPKKIKERLSNTLKVAKRITKLENVDEYQNEFIFSLEEYIMILLDYVYNDTTSFNFQNEFIVWTQEVIQLFNCSETIVSYVQNAPYYYSKNTKVFAFKTFHEYKSILMWKDTSPTIEMWNSIANEIYEFMGVFSKYIKGGDILYIRLIFDDLVDFMIEAGCKLGGVPLECKDETTDELQKYIKN